LAARQAPASSVDADGPHDRGCTRVSARAPAGQHATGVPFQARTLGVGLAPASRVGNPTTQQEFAPRGQQFVHVEEQLQELVGRGAHRFRVSSSMRLDDLALQRGRMVRERLPGHVDQIESIGVDVAAFVRGEQQSAPGLGQSGVVVRRVADRPQRRRTIDCGPHPARRLVDCFAEQTPSASLRATRRAG